MDVLLTIILLSLILQKEEMKKIEDELLFVVLDRGGQWGRRHEARHGHDTCSYSTAHHEHVLVERAAQHDMTRGSCRA